MDQNAAYSVHSLSERKLPWLARRKLRKAKKKCQTGVLLHGIIRTPARSFSSQQPIVSIRDAAGHRLGSVSPQAKFPKWADLSIGQQKLTFFASRTKSSSSFSRDVNIHSGEVLIAMCEPIQPWSLLGASPSTDRWYIGIV